MPLLRFAMLSLFTAFPLTLPAAELPAVVSVVGSDSKMTVGELSRESETQIEIADLQTGETTLFEKEDLKSVRKDLSERSVIDKVGLPTYMAWRVFYASPDGAVAVLPIEAASGAVNERAKSLADELTTALANRDLSVLERRSTAQALGELPLQQGEKFDEVESAKIGRQLGASAVVVVSVRAKGKLAETHLRLIDVKTGQILVALTHAVKDEAVVAEAAEIASKRTEGLIVGKFEVVWTESTGKRGVVNYVFEPNGTALKAGERVGTWTADEATVRLDYFEAARGGVVISPTDRTTFKALHTWANGDRSSWIGKRVE